MALLKATGPWANPLYVPPGRPPPPRSPTAFWLVQSDYLDHVDELPPERPADLEELVRATKQLDDVNAMTRELYARVTGNTFETEQNNHAEQNRRDQSPFTPLYTSPSEFPPPRGW